MRKPGLLIYLALLLIVSLVFVACEQNSQEETLEFMGEGEYWNVEFIVTKENDVGEVDISANYLGDSSEIEEIDTIQYTYEWLHEEAELIEEKDDIEFHGEDAESTVHMISIASALTREGENMFSGEGFISDSSDSKFADIEINELADYIRINIEWNGEDEMIKIEKNN